VKHPGVALVSLKKRKNMNGEISLKVTWYKKANDLIGIRVIDEAGGDVGTISDVLFTDQGSVVSAIVIKKKAFRHPEIIIHFKDIKRVTKDWVMVDMDGATSVRESDQDNNRSISNNSITGLTVLTKEGEEIGVIRDVLIDLDRGRVNAYEMSESFFDDLLDGRKLIPPSKDATINKNNYIISKETQNNIKPKKAGLKKLLSIKKEEIDSGQ
jgi:uncharacterized protein YrrD